MDILTLELLDVTVFQALLELKALLADHPGEALRIRGEDDLLRMNVQGFLEKQGRPARLLRQGGQWELQVPRAARSEPAPAPPAPTPRPVLLMRSAFAPGDRALGRRLLLESLEYLPPGTPWLCLAHQAMDLLEDPGAVAVLEGLQARGIRVQVSVASQAFGGRDSAGFASCPDETWQKLLVRGDLTVL